MTELEAYRWIVGGWVALAALSFVVLLRVDAPYGRHRRPGWGPTMGARLAWVLMELPAVLVLPALAWLGGPRGGVEMVFLLLWEIHYLYRTFVFPFQLRGPDRRTPLVVVLLGAAFNVVNGYLHGRWLFALGPARDASWLADPRFVGGALLFTSGFALHVWADRRLVALRPADGGEYRIPRGGAFRWVSCPNYLGEIVEWGGWALLTASPPGLAFALWTFANLAPRARAHHRWYRGLFPDYPSERRGLVPFCW